MSWLVEVRPPRKHGVRRGAFVWRRDEAHRERARRLVAAALRTETCAVLAR